MAGLADRYLRTLDNHNLELETTNGKSPLKPSKASPQKAEAKEHSPVSRSPAKSSIRTPAGSPSKLKSESPIKSPTRSPVKSPAKSAQSPAKSPTKTLANDSPSKLKTDTSNISNLSSLKSAVKSLNINNTNNKPDRNPLLHNEDLTASEIHWDKERKNWQAYEYLCHVQEAKEWLESIIGEKLVDTPKLPESLQDGITLAKVTKHFRPDLVTRPIFTHKRLQYRHIENISYFMDLLQVLQIPDLFTFDVTDLYEKRNLPKVIYCIHALSHFLAGENEAPVIDDLVGKLEFTDDQLASTQQGLDAAGAAMPNFGAAKRHFSGKQAPQPPPAESAAENTSVDSIQVKDTKLTEEPPADSVSDEETGDGLNVEPRRRHRYKSVARDLDSDIDSEDESAHSYHRREYKHRDSHYRDYSYGRYTGGHDRGSFSSYDSYDMDPSAIRSYGRYDRYSHYRSRRRDITPVHRDFSTEEIMLMELEALEPEICKLQSLCRGRLVRGKFNYTLSESKKGDWVTQLQSAYLGNKVRRRLRQQALERSAHLSAIETLQAAARGCLLRQRLEGRPRISESLVVNLQSVARGKFARQKARKSQHQKATVTQIQALSRGFLARKKVNSINSQLRAEQKSIAMIQSSFRGLLERFRLGCLYDDLDQEYMGIIYMQSRARGALVRRRFQNTQVSWEKNLQKIVLLQAVWRAKTQKRAYSALMAEKNPSLSDLRAFLHLINDNTSDYEETLLLENVRRQISDKVKDNDRLEKLIDQLDTKIALLVKNKISLNDVALTGSPSTAERPATGHLDTLKNLNFESKSLSKTSRDRVELYQTLFYILQTQSRYLASFIAGAPAKVQYGKTHLDTAQLISSVFGGAKTARDQYFFLQLLGTAIADHGLGSESSDTVVKLVSALNNRKESRAAMKQLLKPSVDRAKASQLVDLESNPLEIYRSLGLEDLASQTAETAIQHPSVRQQFVHNLQQLRQITADILRAMMEGAKSGSQFPYHIQYLARMAFEGAWRRTQSKQEALLAVGQVVVGHFIVPFLTHADSLDLVDSAVHKYTQKNLKMAARILSQIASLKPFSATQAGDMFLQPLNEFVVNSVQSITAIFAKIVAESDDLDSHFGFSAMDDVTSKERPHLKILTSDLLAMHSVCFHEISKMNLEADGGILRSTIDQLGSLPKDAREFLDLARFEHVTLELNPSCGQFGTDGDATVNGESRGSSSLLAIVKRCLIYVLRVQLKGSNVMEVLISPVELEHEHAYNLLLEAQSEAEAAEDLSNLTFRELKLLTLEKVLELESSGAITREDGYQALLNAIADDIRDKDKIRNTRSRNLTSSQLTLRGLEEKGEYLQTRLKTYTNYIEQAMATLQESAHQQHRRRKSHNFMPFAGSSVQSLAKYGSYRATGEKLMEKNILLRLKGYSERQLKDVYVTITCDAIAKFTIEIVYKGTRLPGGSTLVTLDELLNKQYNAYDYIELFDDIARFSTDCLLQLILRKFYGASI